MEPEKKKTIPEVSYETVALTEALAKLEPGELIHYTKLSAVCGRDVRTIARTNMYSAINRAVRDHNIVVECVRTEGYRRVDGGELLNAQSSGIKRIRAESRRRTRRLGCTDWNKLTQEEKGRLNAQLSIYGVVRHITTTQKTKLLAAEMSHSEAKPLPIGRTMEFFQGKKYNGET